MNKKEELRYVIMEFGVQFVIPTGRTLILMLYVDHWVMMLINVSTVCVIKHCFDILLFIFVAPITLVDSYFSDGLYPIGINNVACNGWEKSLLDCNKEPYLQFECARSDLAGVRCYEGISYYCVAIT